MHAFSRPRVLALAVVVGVAAAAVTAQADEAADRLFRFAPIDASGAELSARQVVSEKRIAMPLFRMAFIVANSISAEVQAGTLPGRSTSGAQSSLFVGLSGVDAETMQRITDITYQALLAQLRESGKQVTPEADLQRYWPAFRATPSPPGKPYSRIHAGRSVLFFAPTGMPLVMTPLESGWADPDLADPANHRKLLEISTDLDSAVIAPVVVLDFLRMRSSGTQTGRFQQEASTGAEAVMRVASFGSVYVRTSRGGGATEGVIQMLRPAESALEFGTVHVMSQQVNGQHVLPSGSLPGTAAAAGRTRTTMQADARTTNNQYFLAAVDAVGRASTAFGSWLRGVNVGASSDRLRLKSATRIDPASAAKYPR